MKKTLAHWIVGCFLLGIGTVAGLLGLSKDIKDQPGSFLRQYPPHPVLESKMIKLKEEPYYFAGATNSNIYLANANKPLELLEIKSDMSDTSTVHLDIDEIEGSRYVRITVSVDSPYFYVMDGAIPYMYRGKISNWKGSPFMADSTHFVDALPISSTSFVIRALSTKTKEYALGKMVINSKNPITLNYDLLQRQFDGLFDVNGSLSFNKDTKRIGFVYYYRNQYMTMDTTVDLEYFGNTIDTFKTAHIRSAKVVSENTIRLASPPLITNKSHDTYKDWLLVHSLLPAKNEFMKNFEKASIVDVYNLPTRSYEFSFYVFDEGREKMKEFKIINNTMYVLYGHYLRKFDLADQYFKTNARRDEEEYFSRDQSGM